MAWSTTGDWPHQGRSGRLDKSPRSLAATTSCKTNIVPKPRQTSLSICQGLHALTRTALCTTFQRLHREAT